MSSTSDSPVQGRRSRRHYAWAAATVVLVSAGVVGAVFAARVVAGIESDQSRKSFDSSSASIASNVELAIQHEDDIVVDAGGLLADPNLSQTSFLRWATAARTLDRYPEMTGLAVMQLVEDADLPAFAARAEADPAGPLSADGTFQVVPEGTRPFYCLVAAVVSDGSTPSSPAGTDYCAEPMVQLMLLTARDSGRGTYLPYPYQGKTWLAIQTPVYHSGVRPATLDARRDGFAGLVVAQRTNDVCDRLGSARSPPASMTMSSSCWIASSTFEAMLAEELSKALRDWSASTPATTRAANTAPTTQAETSATVAMAQA